ncbi:LON peptidase substrate-binding domain-containing protein [Muricoccus radiodurans]|uniref:LON peptidase substrate-binding domain-containing protein n=1 Tax=Muricoccus radiodurans TaxID=2231721 RepID=UPI003CEDADC4
MAFDPPSLAALPAEIAVFPLTGALLLPGGRLPLNIFEPRYLAMVEDSLATRRSFGMIQPDPGAGRRDGEPGFYRVGCLGRLSSFAETEDGRFLITLTGVIRFAVTEELTGRGGYRRVRPDYAPYAADLMPQADGAADRPTILTALRPYFRAKSIEANWETIERMDSAALVTTLAMVCPFDPREKQALLEAPTAAARSAMLISLLQMDSLANPGQDSRPS